MDQQAAPLDRRLPHLRPDEPAPLAPLALVASLIGIAVMALLICCMLAVSALVVLVIDVGRDGANDFYQELRFDTPLKTQIGAFVVSGLYAGVALATVAAAYWRGRDGWQGLVALSPVRRWREVAAIVAVTLAYAATVTYWLEHDRGSQLLVSGPTDLLLVGTIVANLVLFAPVAEELAFRGWIYTALRRRIGLWPSFLLTVALFAAIHWDPNHRRILQVLPLAVALGLLRERSGSIKATIALHATYNAIIIAIRLAYT